MTRIIGTLHEDVRAFIIIPRYILLRVRMFQTKFVQKIKTHLLSSIIFFRKSYRLRDNKYIVACLLQRWLRERATMLRYRYGAYLVL